MNGPDSRFFFLGPLHSIHWTTLDARACVRAVSRWVSRSGSASVCRRDDLRFDSYPRSRGFTDGAHENVVKMAGDGTAGAAASGGGGFSSRILGLKVGARARVATTNTTTNTTTTNTTTTRFSSRSRSNEPDDSNYTKLTSLCVFPRSRRRPVYAKSQGEGTL